MSDANPLSVKLQLIFMVSLEIQILKNMIAQIVRLDIRQRDLPRI